MTISAEQRRWVAGALTALVLSVSSGAQTLRDTPVSDSGVPPRGTRPQHTGDVGLQGRAGGGQGRTERSFPTRSDNSPGRNRETGPSGGQGRTERSFPTRGDNAPSRERESGPSGAGQGRTERSFPTRSDNPPSRERDSGPSGAGQGRTERPFPTRSDTPASRERENGPGSDVGRPIGDSPWRGQPPASRDRESGPSSGGQGRTERSFPTRGDNPPSRERENAPGSDVGRPVGDSPWRGQPPVGRGREREWEERGQDRSSRDRDFPDNQREWSNRSTRGGAAPRWEVRDRDRWRGAPAARDRESMVLRNTRPPGRPGFIWATHAGFYGFWGSGTCAPWFTPGITVFSPAWCPFNNRIAYVEWVGPARRILVYDSVWGTPRPFLGNDWDYADQLSWSPDGRYLAFVGRRFGEEGLFLLDTVTGTTQRIANGFDRCVSPVWHPRGNGLFFLGSRFGSRRVYRIDPWSGFATPCDNIPFGDIQRILVTPDGGGLVLGMAGGAGWTEIWDVDLSGRSMSRPLMRLQGPFEQPTFSPDGRRIHFTQSEGDAVRLLSIDRSGSDLRVHGDPLR